MARLSQAELLERARACASMRVSAPGEGLPGPCPHAGARAARQVDHVIQYGEDADVKIRDLGMGELGGDDI